MEFFQEFTSDILDVVVSVLKPKAFTAGSCIITAGEIGQCMYFLYKGSAELISETDGKTILQILHEGSYFGEYALLFSQKRAATVKCITHCDTFVLERKDFNMLQKFPEFEAIVTRMKRKYIFSNN